MSMALIMSALGALALTSGIALAAAEAPGAAQPGGEMTRAAVVERVAARFTRMDADGDGQLTAADRSALKARMSDKMFARMDSDGNGQISRAEFDAAAERRTAMREQRGARMAARAGGPGGGRGGAMLRRADADQNGAVTREEMERFALARFDRVDADRNGVITAAEREQARAAMRERFGG